MIKRILVLITALTVFSFSANAATLLSVDLSVVNQITITATSGASDATVSGSDTTGFYLASFFDAAAAGGAGDTLVSGDLTSAANASDFSPDLFVAGGNFGLNVFSFTNDPTADFVAGSQAFSGSATWTLSSGAYAAYLMGPAGGDVYFAADTDDDLAGAMVLGQWERAAPIPVPAAIWLLGSALAGFGVFGARKKA